MRIQKTINGVVHYFECNHTAFESIYSKQGFTACEPAKSDDVVQEEPLDDEQEPADSVTYKPIAQWTDSELRAFARQNDMNPKTPIGILRYRIKTKLEERNDSA